MWPLIIVVVISGLLMIGAYQIVLHKYYWGPGRTHPDRKNNPRQNADS
jgi:hypothetical protein